MRPEIRYYLDQNPDFVQFVRMNPIWYRDLSRQPEKISEVKQEADDFFGRSFSKKVERFGERITMLNMLLDLVKVAGDDQDNEKKAD